MLRRLSLNKKTAVLCLCPLTLLMGACWDSREIGTLSLVTAAAIDAAHGRENLYTIQTANLSAKDLISPENQKKDGPGQNIFPLKESSFARAVNALSFGGARQLFLQHNQILVFGKAKAAEGIGGDLDFFARNSESRMETALAVAEESAGEILTLKIPFEYLNGLGLNKMLRNYAYRGSPYCFSFLDYAIRCGEKYASPLLCLVGIKENHGERSAAVKGAAVFKHHRLAGILSLAEAQGLNWLAGENRGRIITLELPDGRAFLTLTKLKSDVKVKKDKNGALIIAGEIKAGVNIEEMHGFKKGNIKEISLKLQEKAAAQIREEIDLCLEKSKKINCDICGFAEGVYSADAKLWREIEKDWEKIFPTLGANIKISVYMDKTGKINSVFTAKGQNHEG